MVMDGAELRTELTGLRVTSEIIIVIFQTDAARYSYFSGNVDFEADVTKFMHHP